MLEAGRGHGIRPFGEEALMMLRIEAGLPLIDVEWHNSRLAFTDHDRVTPKELGMGWMLRGVARRRPRRSSAATAIRRELADEHVALGHASAIVVDWADWDRLHRDAGLLPTKDEHPLPYESVLHDRPTTTAARRSATSPASCTPRCCSGTSAWPGCGPTCAAPGTEVHMELALNHPNTTVLARTAKLPLFNPARKTAKP